MCIERKSSAFGDVVSALGARRIHFSSVHYMLSREASTREHIRSAVSANASTDSFGAASRVIVLR